MPSYNRKVIFVSEEVAYAVGEENSSDHEDGAIYYTTDGGATWKGSRVHETSTIFDVYFPHRMLVTLRVVPN
jgi:photosystem II stability/assembly factor-like uncharacterized protein